MAMRMLRRLGRSEAGSYSVEAVLWVPIYVLMLGAIIDLSLLFYNRAGLTELAHQVNRGVAVGHFADATDAQAFLATRLGSYGDGAQGTVTIRDQEVETRLSVPAADISAMGAIPLFTDLVVNLSYTHLLERR